MLSDTTRPLGNVRRTRHFGTGPRGWLHPPPSAACQAHNACRRLAVEKVGRHEQLERVLGFDFEVWQIALIVSVLELVVKVLDGLLEHLGVDLGELDLALLRLLE